MILSLIVATGLNNEIGLNNKLLWSVPEDMKNFVRLTKNKVIVVGRKTFESFKGPLPKRLNLILTTNKNYSYDHPDVKVFTEKESLLDFCKASGFEEVVICGGAEIYKIFLPLCDRIYLSKIDWQGSADTYFPKLNMDNYKIVSKTHFDKNGETPAWEFLELHKI